MAVHRGDTFYVRNSLTAGPADEIFVYGKTGDLALAGDWDGDGVDTFIVRRGATFFVKNTMSAGPADQTRVLGTGNELAYTVYAN